MKGSVVDLFGLILIVFVFGISAIIAHALMTAIAAQGQTIFPNNYTKEFLNTSVGTIKNLDYATVFVVFGTGIAIILSAFFVRTHPAFFIISIFMLVFVLIVASQFANIFTEFEWNPAVVASAAQFTYTQKVFQYLPLIILVIGIIMSIVMYSKIYGGGGADEYY